MAASHDSSGLHEFSGKTWDTCCEANGLDFVANVVRMIPGSRIPMEAQKDCRKDIVMLQVGMNIET